MILCALSNQGRLLLHCDKNVMTPKKEYDETGAPRTCSKVCNWDTVDDSVQSKIEKEKKGKLVTQAVAETISNEFKKNVRVTTHLGILGYCATRQDTGNRETRKPGKHQARETARLAGSQAHHSRS